MFEQKNSLGSLWISCKWYVRHCFIWEGSIAFHLISIVVGGGESNGLSVILTPNRGSYISYTRPGQGVLFDIHAEEEYADLHKLTLLEPGVGFKYFVLQSVVKSDSSVRFQIIYSIKFKWFRPYTQCFLVFPFIATDSSVTNIPTEMPIRR